MMNDTAAADSAEQWRNQLKSLHEGTASASQREGDSNAAEEKFLERRRFHVVPRAEWTYLDVAHAALH